MKMMKTIAGGIVVLALTGTGSAWASGRSGPERIFIYGVGSTFDLNYKVVASGPVSGVGEMTIVEETSDDSHQDFTAELVFPNGSITIRVTGPSTINVNPAACAGSLRGTLQWTITGGTGAYEGASGSGTGAFAEWFVVERGPEGCSEGDAVAVVLTSHLSGTVAA